MGLRLVEIPWMVLSRVFSGAYLVLKRGTAVIIVRASSISLAVFDAASRDSCVSPITLDKLLPTNPAIEVVNSEVPLRLSDVLRVDSTRRLKLESTSPKVSSTTSRISEVVMRELWVRSRVSPTATATFALAGKTRTIIDRLRSNPMTAPK